jgi:hypothetical protein
MKTPDILSALTPVIEAFEQLSIPYYIGGSVASSIYGMARATMDVDVVADINRNHVPKLKEKLDEKYYIDEDMIFGAINNSSSFNLIHLETAIKIDVFIYRDEPHQRKAIERKVKDKFDDEFDFEYYFSAPEDIIIAKLQWFEQGNRISERQWLDILGVIKVQGEKLDIRYLKTWTQELGLFELLEKALNESGIQFKE